MNSGYFYETATIYCYYGGLKIQMRQI